MERMLLQKIRSRATMNESHSLFVLEHPFRNHDADARLDRRRGRHAIGIVDQGHLTENAAGSDCPQHLSLIVFGEPDCNLAGLHQIGSVAGISLPEYGCVGRVGLAA
tara:strand:- start:4 stop:324 length:321 start_codon:yes stop_codon:yes gene_type:complete